MSLLLKHPLARPLGSVSTRDAPGIAPVSAVERMLMAQLRECPVATPTTRTKIWELHANFHCSIVGTCLTTGELRSLLLKLKAIPGGEASDHELHAAGVLLASSRGVGAKLLHKTLDRKFHQQIARAAAARTEEAVRSFWDESLEAADIPGGYWVVLTHPASTQTLVRHVFGEVHMLSHLVGAANRADIRRLRQLETETTLLQEKIERQQAALRNAIVARDHQIAELRALLSASITLSGTASQPAPAITDRALDAVLRDTRNRLQQRERRVAHLESRVGDLDRRAALATERAARAEAESEQLRDECQALESRLADLLTPSTDPVPRPPSLQLDGLVILYVGGRPHQRAQFRAVVEQAGGVFLHHSGGTDETNASLPGCVSGADAVLFPVDCVSHAAAVELKRLCKQADKPFLPLRTASVATLLRGLERLGRHAPPHCLAPGAATA